MKPKLAFFEANAASRYISRYIISQAYRFLILLKIFLADFDMT